MCFQILKSSVGKKAVMAVTGVFLFGFVIAHMLGNLQIFLGQDALNEYAEHLEELPFLLWPARVFLLTTLIIHMATGIVLAIENKKARPIPYIQKATVQASAASRTMVMSGLIIFAFIVYHLLHFTWGVTNPEFFHLVDSKGREDVYSMVILSFQNISISAAYLFAMAVLCFHLGHGLPALFQSLGFNNEKWMPKFELSGKAAALLIFIGNSSVPLAALLHFLKPVAGVLG